MDRKLKPIMKCAGNGKVFCSVHGQRAFNKIPSTSCRICWLIYDSFHRLKTIEEVLLSR